MEIEKLLSNNIEKENKVLSNFVNHRKIDKLIRIRAALQGKQKSEIIKEALIEYFKKCPITKEELKMLN